MKYRINSTGNVILADLDFVEQYHPGDFTEVIDAPVVTPLPREMTKREWRLQFTDAERPPIDRFNAQFESNALLTEPQRDAVRSGLEDYKAATVINKDDPATAQMLGLYVALGMLAANRPAEILA